MPDPMSSHLRASIRPSPTSNQNATVPESWAFGHSSNVASPNKNPIAIVAIKVHDIEFLKKSG